jgi:hypothetical protein
MFRILALQSLQAIGPDHTNETSPQGAVSSCSYLACSDCSSDSWSACKPAPVFVVSV